MKEKVKVWWSGWARYIKGDLWLKDRSKSEREGLVDGSKIYYDAWFGEGGTSKRKGGRAEDDKISTGNDQD